MKKNKGFTLIELLIVILILGILMAIIIPNYIRFQESARRVSVKANMRVVQTAMEGWAVNHDGMYPATDDATIWDPTNLYGISPYFPGGDPIGEAGTPRLGNFPTNPYTRKRYNDPASGITDLTYTEEAGTLTASGVNAIVRSDDPNCVYDDLPATTMRGHIRVLNYVPEGSATTEAEEYGICGYGRDMTEAMYDPGGVAAGGAPIMIFFALFNN